MKTLLLSSFLTIAILLATAGETPTLAQPSATPPPRVARPSAIYVADFDLGQEAIKPTDSNLASRRGPVGRVGSRLSGTKGDPESRARELVDLMSKSLVKELTKAGFTANRLAPGTPLPTNGWLVRGVFTEVGEGNRLKRSMIGMGQGQTDVQVIANVHNLSDGPPQPMYELAADANSGSKVGAAPTLVLGPYGAAARFVMAGKDLDKNVKQTAKAMATRLAERVQPAP